METILKLLKSPVKEDILIGLSILLQRDPGDIIGFFEANRQERGEGWIDITLSTRDLDNIPNSYYIMLGYLDWGIIIIEKRLRLRRTNLKGTLVNARKISKIDYLNGMY